MTADDILAELLDGNRRFIAGESIEYHEARDWREQLATSQHPIATIVGCADSRVPIELLFDQGFGDLFVIRVAGNVIGTNVAASIEYGVVHLNTPLVMVLGHSSCGAVTAALSPDLSDQPEDMGRLLTAIQPALDGIDRGLSLDDQVAAGVTANVRYGVSKLGRIPELAAAFDTQGVRLVGAVYHLDTCRVELIEPADESC